MIFENPSHIDNIKKMAKGKSPDLRHADYDNVFQFFPIYFNILKEVNEACLKVCNTVVDCGGSISRSPDDWRVEILLTSVWQDALIGRYCCYWVQILN